MVFRYLINPSGLYSIIRLSRFFLSTGVGWSSGREHSATISGTVVGSDKIPIWTGTLVVLARSFSCRISDRNVLSYLSCVHRSFHPGCAVELQKGLWRRAVNGKSRLDWTGTGSSTGSCWSLPRNQTNTWRWRLWHLRPSTPYLAFGRSVVFFARNPHFYCSE